MENLEFHLTDSNITMELYEMLLANCSQIILQSKDGKIRSNIYNPKNDLITPKGFDQEESLFPVDPQTFEGYRLFRKFFILPQSFMFIQVNKVKHALMEMNSEEINMIFLFDRENLNLKGKISKKSFELFCTPIVNLFGQVFFDIGLGKGLSKINLFQESSSESIEILKVLEVQGVAETNSKAQKLLTLQSTSNLLDNAPANSVSYSLSCTPRSLTEEELNEMESNYPGTNTYLSLVDSNNKPHKGSLDQLRVTTLCSNRGLPMTIPFKKKDIYFTTDFSGITKIKLVSDLSKPYCDHILIPPWDIINHISLNFLTLNDEIPKGIDASEDQNPNNSRNFGKTAEIIKNILKIYTVSEMQKRQIKGIKSIATTRKQQRFNNKGDFSFVNGLSIDLVFDKQKTNNYFLLGMIIDRFFMHATPVDTFTQTTVNIEKLGKVIQWPAKKGTRPLI